MTHTLDTNLEYTRRALVIDAITNLQNVITKCYGKGEFPSTTFSDQDIHDLYYNANSVACKLYEEQNKMEGENDE